MKTDSARAVNRATFASLANGVTLMQASFADHVFERHSHDCYAIGVTTYGIQRFRCKGKRYDSQAGDFVLFNPDEDHDGNPGTPEGFRYTIWYVPEAFVASVAGVDGKRDGSRYFSRPHVADAGMAARFRQVSASLGGIASESLREETLTSAFLETVLRRYGERPGDARAPAGQVRGASLARVKDYIRTYYQRDITVSDLASVAGLSRAHLTRAFSAAYHVSPHVYLNAVRLAQAQTLIRLGMPLAAVAVECGFGDQSHLARRFKGSVGVTPSDWREQLLPATPGSRNFHPAKNQ